MIFDESGEMRSLFLFNIPKLGHFFGAILSGGCDLQRIEQKKRPHFASFVKKHLFPKEPVQALGGAERCPRSLSEVG